MKNPQLTRSKILNAAFNEIFTKGYVSANLENIVSASEVTRGALYHHFANKQDLGYAVVSEVIRPLIFDRWLLYELPEADDPIKFIQNRIDFICDVNDSQLIAFGCPLNNLVQEMSGLDSGFNLRLQSILEDWKQSFSKSIERAKKNGKIRKNIDCEATAIFVISAIEGAFCLSKSATDLDVLRMSLKQLKLFLSSLYE